MRVFAQSATAQQSNINSLAIVASKHHFLDSLLLGFPKSLRKFEENRRESKRVFAIGSSAYPHPPAQGAPGGSRSRLPVLNWDPESRPGTRQRLVTAQTATLLQRVATAIVVHPCRQSIGVFASQEIGAAALNVGAGEIAKNPLS